MDILKYKEIQTKLDSIFIAYKLIGTIQIEEVFETFHDAAYNGNPGCNMFFDDFIWKISMHKVDPILITLSNVNKELRPNIKRFLKKKMMNFEHRQSFGKDYDIFTITISDWEDIKIDAAVEFTEYYLSLKSGVQLR